MGSEQGASTEKPVHRVYVAEFRIARVPVTNAQYSLYVKDTKATPPSDWRGGQPPAGKENHPVVNVSWHDAQAYCRWLGAKTGKAVRLPTEAEWEKAARGDKDKRAYPWGDDWEALRCNSEELGLGDTSPVGLFLKGASPYGVLDMTGNVWEWTSSLWGKDVSKPDFKYPYNPKDGREELSAPNDMHRVLRGGSFDLNRRIARCAVRLGNYPNNWLWLGYLGFRVVVSPLQP
jgi:iron(II)-dependent oxidoreductase